MSTINPFTLKRSNGVDGLLSWVRDWFSNQAGLTASSVVVTASDGRMTTGGATATEIAALGSLGNSQLVVTGSGGAVASLAAPSLTEIGYVTGVTSAIQTQFKVAGRGSISGIVISNDDAADGDDINFTAGAAFDSTGVYAILAAAEMTKRADTSAWSAGDNGGGLPAALTWTADTDYHLHLLGNSTNPTAYDYGFDTSLTAANLLADSVVDAAGFDIYRRVASLRSSGTPGWPGITARELAGGALEVLHLVMVQDYSSTNPGTTATLLAISVPGGIKVTAIIAAQLSDSSPAAATFMLITSPDQTDTAASSAAHQLELNATTAQNNNTELQVRTNTSRQIRRDLDNSDTGVRLRINTNGWIDDRR